MELFFHFVELFGTQKTTSLLGQRNWQERGFLKLYLGHWFVLVCCYIIIHKKVNPPYIHWGITTVCIYVCGYEQHACVSYSSSKKRDYKNLFFKLCKSTNYLEFSRYTPSISASCPMSTHPSIDSSIYLFTNSSFQPISAIHKLNPKTWLNIFSGWVRNSNSYSSSMDKAQWVEQSSANLRVSGSLVHLHKATCRGFLGQDTDTE